MEDDGRFVCEVNSVLLRWSGTGETPWKISTRSSGRVSGRVLSQKSLQAEATLHLERPALRLGEKEIGIPSPLDLSVSLMEVNDQGLAASDLRIQGPGLDAQTTGELRWKGESLAISLQGPRLETSSLESVLPFLPPGTELAGSCSLAADSISWKSGAELQPPSPAKPFHPRLPGNLAMESLHAKVTQGRVLLSPVNGLHVKLGGLQADLKQEGDSKWTGRVEAASSEISPDGPQDDLRIPSTKTGPGKDPPESDKKPWFSGSFNLQGQWTESAQTSHAVLVADLTGGRALYGKVLDKPAGVPLQAGGRVRFGADEIRVGRAFLHLGETEWKASGTLKNPEDPVLDLQLASGTVSLDQVAGFSPAAAEHGARGLVEIQRFQLKGKTRDLKKTATMQARIAGKSLEYNRASIEGCYLEAVYGEEVLSVSPLIVYPGPGRVEATFTGDFSGAFRTRGRQQYYGTVKMQLVELDKIVTLAHPEYSGRVSGVVDVNAAGRGTGKSWEAIRRSLEARVRIYLKNFQIHGDRGKKLMEPLAPEDARGVDPSHLNREERRLLSGNNASALGSLKDEKIRVRNLVATYEGKVVEMDGSLDFSGRLRVNQGSLFLKNRRVPFRLNCRIGEGKCLPAPDLKEMGKSAAHEIFQGMQALSSGSRDVFKDLLF